MARKTALFQNKINGMGIVQSKLSTCQFSASPAQIGFWAGHGLTTVGVVYDPDTDCAWWVDLTAVAKENRNCIGSKTISFVKARWNHFNQFGFENVLLPMLLGLAPRLSLEGAIDWTKSDDFDTHDLGARVLLARFKESGSAWETLLSSFRARGAAASFSVIRGLIRVMGHTDEGFYGNEMPWDVRTDMQQEILNFGKRDLVELLKFVDDGDFERGGTGWGMLALIPPNPDAIDILSEIAIDSDLEKLVRDNARALLGMHQADLHFWSLWEPSRPCGAQ